MQVCRVRIEAWMLIGAQKVYTLSELEGSVDTARMRKNEGEAAMYGITYDDSAYDYMSHLRPLNQPGASDVVLLPAPKGSGVAKGMKPDRKGKGKAEELFGLPDDMFASKEERTMREVYESAQNIPDGLRGLQPDMDPHLRQVLEALDDDAFVDGEGEDIFDELLAGGETADGEEAEEFEFEEWGVDDRPHADDEGDEGEAEEPELREAEEETWEDRFKAFKAAQKAGTAAVPDASEVDEAERSEMADTIGSLSSMADMMVIGGKKRRGKRGPSDATGMSMSSSSMFRNEGLRDLDERFDRVSHGCCQIGDTSELAGLALTFLVGEAVRDPGRRWLRRRFPRRRDGVGRAVVHVVDVTRIAHVARFRSARGVSRGL